MMAPLHHHTDRGRIMTEHRQLSILAADSQPSILRMYEKVLGSLGHKLDVERDGSELQTRVQAARYDVLIIDVSLLGANTETALRALAQAAPDLKIIAVSDRATVAVAVAAIKAGCANFLTKPLSMQALEQALQALSCSETLIVPKPKDIQTSIESEGPNLVGYSPAMQRVRVTIANFASSTAPVLITGESGTGKDVCATLLHQQGPRANGPFVAINCAALPGELMESELFGHVKGAFTGATSDRAGAALAAHGGMLFLDEIGEMDIALQAKLLRFLQTGEIKKVGSDKAQTVDVRVICATNRDLTKLVEEGVFREDLYYRLNVLTIAMPALRERGNDLIELARHFYDCYVQLEGGEGGGLTSSAVMALVEHSWPGNVRELQNVIRRGVVMSGGGSLNASDLVGLEDTGRSAHPFSRQGNPSPHTNAPSSRRLIEVLRPLAEIEREIVESVIELKGGSVPKAAAALRLSPSTLYRKRHAWTALSLPEDEQLDRVEFG